LIEDHRFSGSQGLNMQSQGFRRVGSVAAQRESRFRVIFIAHHHKQTPILGIFEQPRSEGNFES
jgi:hypothetical protein